MNPLTQLNLDIIAYQNRITELEGQADALSPGNYDSDRLRKRIASLYGSLWDLQEAYRLQAEYYTERRKTDAPFEE